MLSLFAWFLNTFLLPKGLPDKGFKKLYYRDFPCSFIPPSSNMEGNIMPLHRGVPPPLTLVGCSLSSNKCLVSLKTSPEQLEVWSLVKDKRGSQASPSLTCHARKHPSKNRSHRAALR